MNLDLFCGALADCNAVFTPHVGLDCRVDVETADTNRFECNDTAEADDGRLAGAAADVDDHVANRFVDGKLGTDRRGHRLFDQLRVGGTRTACCVGDRTAFDLGDRRGHTNDDLWSGEARDTNTLQQKADHALGDVKVGDGPAAQRPDGHDVSGGTADHVPRLVTGGKNLAGFAVHGNDRGLVEHDSTALHVDERVRRSEVDSKVAGHVQPV